MGKELFYESYKDFIYKNIIQKRFLYSNKCYNPNGKPVTYHKTKSIVHKNKI